MSDSLQVLKHPISEHGIHVDFLRLRCGSEARFARGLNAVRKHSPHSIHSFIAFSEWDAVLVVRSPELYPPALTEIYANPDVAASVSGTSGYFAYIWDHPINALAREHLTRFEAGGPAILMSLRFADWLRRDIGLSAELLFCDHLQRLLEAYPGVHVVVAHSLGWNDVILLMHAESDEARLTKVLATLRLMTLGDCIPEHSAKSLGFSEKEDAQIFAASYSHLLGALNSYRTSSLSLGTLSKEIQSARLLIRIAPPQEPLMREFVQAESLRVGATSIVSEMGHYSLSVDISKITRDDGGKGAIGFVAAIRKAIRRLSRGNPDSYAETTTIFRFREPRGTARLPVPPKLPKDLAVEIVQVKQAMRDLPGRLRHLGVSSMTIHRFVSVLTTLLDHLSDPVRSSVVRHLSRFANELNDLVTELDDTDAIDDLCHVLEYAVGQAIDGIAQFQHDANALGLSGRGGYSRLIVTVESYIRTMFAYLKMGVPVPLITFGLRSGNAGSTGRYQIDIPFNVLFVPSRWHVLLHEIGHMAWTHTFGWMMESLAIYRAMEREVRHELLRTIRKQPRNKARRSAMARMAAEHVHVEFLRAREIVRELFPSYLTFALPCNGDIKALDALAFRRMLTMGHPTSLTRELLIRVTTHCLLVIMRDSMRKGSPRDPQRFKKDEKRAAMWWGIWEPLRKQSHDLPIQTAIDSISETMTRVNEEARIAVAKESRKRSPFPRSVRHDPHFLEKIQILHSEQFKVSVGEALQSVIQLLALRASHFRQIDSEHIGPPLFGRLLKSISDIQRDQADPAYDEWLDGRFAGWLHAGQVLTRHRAPFIWSRLLLGSRNQLLEGPEGSFMRSQLSVLLSMWHDAITRSVALDSPAAGILKSLNLVIE